MAILWLNMKQEVSLCHGWHSKAKLMSEACRSDHKSSEALVVCIDEVHKNDESREAVEPAYDAWEAYD